MDKQRPPTRVGIHRRPLEDASSRANSATPPSSRPSDKPSAPHHERLKHRKTSPKNSTGPIVVSENQQASVTTARPGLTSGERKEIDNKRASAISNTSSTASANGVGRKSRIGPWQLGKTIGRGGCSTVRAVRHTVSGQFAAAKIVSKKFAETARAQSLANLIQSAETDSSLFIDGKIIPVGLEREIVIMKLLEHKNIVRLYDVWENHNQLYLIMEHVQGGELFNYIEEQKGLREIEAVFLFRQIIAALLYCHRLNIHHRDLKPENILLDRETFAIRLVDFGMAALQPRGKFLSTPCGSPHYAAPEVVSMKPYDGGKADIWSCGVMLYVMLTGVPPFRFTGEAKDIKRLWKLITAADYHMPEALSPEAKDLIKRVLVPKPEHRISIEGIWYHQFLHKYDAEFGLHPEHAGVEHWIGPEPSIDDWRPLTRQTVDRDILRNLRTLWHSESEDVLMRKLISEEPNQEKFFYCALQKFEEEQLENYYGGPHGVSYSSSDHHHVRPTAEANGAEMYAPTHKRTNSQFSIMNDEHLRSQLYLPNALNTPGSYDPFRVEARVSHPNVTIQRGSAVGSRHKSYDTNAPASNRRSSLRVETLRRRITRRSSRLSNSSHSARGSFTSRSSNNARLRSSSGLSMSSLSGTGAAPMAAWPSSSIHPVRSSGLHRRGVSFIHLRRSSTTHLSKSGFDFNGSIGMSTPQTERGSMVETPAGQHIPSSPPVALPRPNIKAIAQQRRETAIRVKNTILPDTYIDNAARKVSTELERVCEEAFNRSSMTSSNRTSVNEKVHPYDTPPSSVSNRDPKFGKAASRKLAGTATGSDVQERPLPALPTETPKTFIARELEETRKRLAARSAEEGDNNTASFKEVITHLDRLLEPSTIRMSAVRTSKDIAKPHGVVDRREDLPVGYESHVRPAATTTDIPQPNKISDIGPVHSLPRKVLTEDGRTLFERETIRIIEASPQGPIRPLNVRKIRTVADMKAEARSSIQNRPIPESGLPARDSAGAMSSNTSAHRWQSVLACDGDAVMNDDAGKVEEKVILRKRKWFRQILNERKERDNDVSPPQPVYIDNSHNHQLTLYDIPEGEPATALPIMAEATDNFPARQQQPPLSLKRGLLKFLGKLADNANDKVQIDASDFSDGSSSKTGLTFPEMREASLEMADETATRAVETQQNWLARFLHIKPVTQALCFRVGRGRARQEIVRLLRDWRRYGIQDISFSRETNVIAARVDKSNYLKIKAVHFVAELFVVLEHGRRAKLCIARFTQTRGAASSFRRVVHAMQAVLNANGLLIEDDVRWRQMCELL